ncbi:hypothetical protein, conserved [Thermococcus kodakarensis KOD1]|uniref:Uncharacterized protein n=3 Tax=Thermococcus TaxID=2263 RepID=Q5JF62_THEKO|nr:CGP-CTERM sorting domain-containing protein [Thermococcus kodakarensis]WCN30915.1 CGP-CTERM sorting domain-containing protein [Thermococcus kodakarensis]BAD84758.1 hypothetical protein, conserved [Thermococcus kodakarensis KOD1]
MKKAAIILAAVVLLSVFGVVGMPKVSAAGEVVIAVDLAHGENPKGLTDVTYENETLTEGMLKVLTDYTFVYFGDSKYEADLGIKNIGDKITYEALKENNVTILIIGQPRSPFYPEEVEAIKKWLEEGGHALWIAGDSDYGTSGVNTINFVDSVLNQLNMTNLRLDQASVEDPVSNAGAPYRVVAYADPWGDTPKRDIIVQGFEHDGAVLAHGPGVVAWVDGVDGSGDWHKLTPEEKPENTYVLIRSTGDSVIKENEDPAANAYTAGEQGEFPIAAAQIIELEGKNPSVIIVSGETPIGGYEPMWTSVYYQKPLDGPKVVSNIFKWSVEITKGESGKSTCGPAFLVGLAVVPLLLRRRK